MTSKAQKLVSIRVGALYKQYFLSTSNSQDRDFSKLGESIAKGFKKEDGPFVKGLDTALKSFHVIRQAYYSGTFVGNHVHRALKV